MPTKLDKTLTRETTLGGGDFLVSLVPGDGGGSLSIKPKGVRGAKGKTFLFADLASGEARESRPRVWGEWIRTEDVQSQIGIMPGLSPRERGILAAAAARVALHLEWSGTDGAVGWEEFLRSKGREDLFAFSAPEDIDPEP